MSGRVFQIVRVSLVLAVALAGAASLRAGGAAAGSTMHWSFMKPVRPAEPAVQNAAWVRNPIDRFILARLEKEGLSPAPEATRETLLRRVYLDLTGLPPSVQETDAFLGDTSPDAYEKVVDRLLASPAYGERWGRHWLDNARYADSNGYSHDGPRSIWKYRDWVVEALNRDMPFDQFSVEQLAGDMLPNPTLEQRIATGFHRNTQINTEGGIDPEQFRIEAVFDRVATTGTVFLGLTVACAQCHDHKFDPISQREFYQLFAFFNNADEPTLEIPVGEEGKEEQGAEKGKGKDKGKVTTLVMAERGEPRESHVFIKGDFTRKGQPVTPAVPAVLHPIKPERAERVTRLDLARWLFDAENPLTARVTVNRIWQQYFGRGLVETENDFGTQGARPTHPELLDWLAVEFRESGWRLKHLHRLIVTSSTYRQSSTVRPDLAVVDPNNRLLARMSRLRLDGEVVRDVALTASGLLSKKMGGPPVFPPQPEGATAVGQVKHDWETSTGEDRYRRGMYTFYFRASLHPLLGAFDAPDATAACTRRNRSNTPLQALNLLNDEAFVEFAQALAGRVLREGPGDDAGRMEYAFGLCTGRKPAEGERQYLLELLGRQTEAFAAAPQEAAALAAQHCPPGVEAQRMAAWTIVSRVLLNMDETITRE